MELEPLRSFVAAIEAGSLTGAARRRHRSQPAITAQIQGLEREIGDRLLVRAARGVRATPAGTTLYRRARAILREADELLEQLRAGGRLEHGQLRIGTTDVMAINYLPPRLQRFRTRYPGIQWRVTVAGSRLLAERVARGELDLALVTLPCRVPGLEARELHREPLCFVAAAQRARRHRRWTLAAVAAEPVIHHAADSVTRAEVAAVFRARGLEPRVTMEVNSPEAIKQLVALDLGLAPLSASQAREPAGAGRIRRLRIPDFECWRRSGVVVPAGSPALRAVSAFLRMLPSPRPRRRPVPPA